MNRSKLDWVCSVLEIDALIANVLAIALEIVELIDKLVMKELGPVNFNLGADLFVSSIGVPLSTTLHSLSSLS